MKRQLHFLEKFYLSVCLNKVLLKRSLESEVLFPLSVDIQEKILDVTVRNQLCWKFPPPISYKKFFLRTILDVAEHYGSELSDGLTEAYVQVLILPVEEVSFCSYIINEKCIITLQENSCFVAKSTTGLQTWEASKYLSEWCINNFFHFKNKRVLELGSGIGLLGLAILKLCQPQKYIFSDKSWEVLNILSTNIKINLGDQSDLPFETHQLVWSTVCEDDVIHLLPDIIVGADLVYDPDMVESLVHALKIFLHKSATAYIATSVRNVDTYEKFLKELGLAGLNYESLPDHKKDLFIYNDSSNFKLHKIYCTEK